MKARRRKVAVVEEHSSLEEEDNAAAWTTTSELSEIDETLEESHQLKRNVAEKRPDQQEIKASSSRWGNFWIRSLWTFVMISCFTMIMNAGHIYVVLMVVALQTLVYKEVIAIAHVPSKEKKLPWFRSFVWYFLFTTNYFLYGESIIHYFENYVLVANTLLPLATHHRFISFFLYVLGLVLFVLNLKKGHYRFQFRQLGFTHMTLLLVVFQSHFIINNIFEGLFWFVFPVGLVIWNDITAYLCGFFFGKTPLIQLSPKKTWEGFIGAFFLTLILGFLLPRYLAQFPYLICPVKNLQSSDCIPNSVFLPAIYHVPTSISGLLQRLFSLQIDHVVILPIQIHGLIMALFASIIAPFGGFFASGFKRACKLKDFGDSIPGHGGITDRLDCEFLMGFFSYMYMSSFIKVSRSSVGDILRVIITNLSDAERMELLHQLRTLLEK